jgi:endonuclease YncB( thermonuclease family)
MSSSVKLIFISIAAVIVFIAAITLAIYLLQKYPNSNNELLNATDAQAIEVIDGDTFRMPSGETIRLLCVDTPEEGQSGYEEARIFLQSRLLFSGDLRLVGEKKDYYNRSLRWVYSGNTLINKEIVEYGFGEVYEYKDENCSLMY